MIDGNPMKRAPGRLTVNLLTVAIFVASVCVEGSGSDVAAPITTRRFFHIIIIISVISLVAVVLVFAAICIACCAGAYVGNVIKTIIMRIDREAIGVDVTIGDLLVVLHTGKVEVRDVTLLNPEPYSSEYMLKAGHVKVDIDVWQFLRTLGRHLTIQSLVFEDVDTIWEKMGLRHSNIKAILDFVEDKQKETNTDLLQQQQQQQQPDRSSIELQPQEGGSVTGHGARDLVATSIITVASIPTRQLTIRQLVIKDVGVKLASHMLGGAGVRLALGDVSITDVSRARTQDLATELAREVLQSVLKTIVQNVAGKSIGEELF